ncbi:low molecular weight phosphotyrosine protein phosphatase [Pseudomonas stutzeri]|nr:low molecular weight phosphotyrosine protein phosphatase [Stutzerimonas stutzeri]
MFKRILIVCVGNICRSPTAEHLMRVAVGDSGIEVSSAGLGALVDKPIESTALSVLESHGHTPHPHKARQATGSILRDHDLILVMERRHIEGVTALAPQVRGKTFLLGKWLDEREIPDPYRRDRETFEHVYKLIDDSVTAWAKRLVRP